MKKCINLLAFLLVEDVARRLVVNNKLTSNNIGTSSQVDEYSMRTRDQLTWEKDVSFWYRFYFPIKMNSTKDMICHRMIFVKISVIPTFSFSLAHYFLFLLLILHLWLQYFTFSQSLFHFFLQEKGFPQTIQSFEGSNFFFITYNDSVDAKSQDWELRPQSF